MYSENDYIQLSALQHFVFCPRQCALIHIEQIWSENLFTAEGRVMHDKVHEEQFESSGNIRIERGIALSSKVLGLSGKADVVEYHKSIDNKSWIPFPVEYKRGKPKKNNCDKVQLCAQAICLEEMMKLSISQGALFYGKIRHRLDVEIDESLRKETEEIAHNVHDFIQNGITPSPVYTNKCKSCSLFSVCMPKRLSNRKTVSKYFEEILKDEKTS